jgi:hypothetical protein
VGIYIMNPRHHNSKGNELTADAIRKNYSFEKFL